MGSLVAAFGFFFFPLLEVKPNRLASGVQINLFELQGDLRYIALFVLALVPLIISFDSQRLRRGWSLVAIGNFLIILTLVLPANAATQLLADAETFFGEGVQISNPRIFTSGAIATGLLGGYIVMFGGLRDLLAENVDAWKRALAGIVGILYVLYALVNGQFDIYSIMVEFSQRGETLGQRFIEHFGFVVVALIAGLIIGIALGLWAARDERMESIILYAVGIIQTVPSLALFGVLLVPLANLGNVPIMTVLAVFVATFVVSLIIFFVVIRIQNNIPEQAKPWSIVIAFLFIFAPIVIFTVPSITVLYRTLLNAFVSPEYSQILMLVGLGYLLAVGLLWLDRRLDKSRSIPWLRYARYLLLSISTLVLIIVMLGSVGQVIPDKEISNLTMRDLGVSGIGIAPALIALTLYSLLPLVRNTYAGLRNVDPAIIDSGRGMGMTPPQIFFQIELPLALPIIMAGVRNAGISLVGISAVASVIGAGALGDFILLGVNTTSVDLILLGAIPAVILAILLDALLQIVGDLFTSPGIKRAQA